MLSSTSQFPNTPVDCLAMFPNLLTDRVALYKFTRKFMGAVPYDEQWLPSQMPPAFIELKRGIGPMTILNGDDRLGYLLTVTANGKTVASSSQKYTLSNGETEWRDTTATPGATY
ncbi:hypothetical protein SPFM1_00142 [Salmonella phage SPFM1]|nr:hypothetical protein SPFM1_00142 [Salmonella phage SPFM1]